MRKKLPILRIFIFFAFLLLNQKIALADTSSGYAWSENTGYIDFSQVIVSSNELSGYAYSPNIGWISLNCSNTSSCGTVDYKVTNANGTLSGYAWSENTGFINFSQVNINTVTGVFSGYAYSSNIGWISLNCSNTSSCGAVDYKVTTIWRPTVVSSGGSSSGGSVYCTDNVTSFCRARPQITAPTQNPPTVPITTDCILNFTQILKLTNPQMNNDNVKLLQICLNTKVASPPLIADGIFGIKSKQAVMIFQKNNSLKADGIVGAITRNKLMNK